SELLSDGAGEWRAPLRAEGRTLRQRVAPGLLARATPARLREAIGVLLDNALRHGKGTVTLAARSGAATVVIEVSDAGPGVPDELVPYVFGRGFSGGGSPGGGLARARALVEADGGRLELGKARPAQVETYLPLAPASAVPCLPSRSESPPRCARRARSAPHQLPLARQRGAGGGLRLPVGEDPLPERPPAEEHAHQQADDLAGGEVRDLLDQPAGVGHVQQQHVAGDP